MPRVSLGHWINYSTAGAHTVVEFGAGFFDKLARVSPTVKKKIGIEAWKSYIDNSKYNGCIKIHGDVREFEDLLDPEDMDCALLIDILEHFDKDEATKLIKRIMSKFNQIHLMIPEGNHPQEKDVTGHGAHEFQTHRSTWYAEDVKALGFQQVTVDENFHRAAGGGKDPGCIFATWKKER